MNAKCFKKRCAANSLAQSVFRLFLCAAGLAIAACSTTSEQTKKAIWESGYVALPESATEHSGCKSGAIKYFDPGCITKKTPVVVFMHGSGGLERRQYDHMEMFARLGYPVFAPESFARPGRPIGKHQGKAVLYLRLEEVEIALENLRKYPWVDQKKLILAGFSEGGFVTREYDGDDFIAIVGMGFSCRTGEFSAPSNVAALQINGRLDREALDTELCTAGWRKKFKAVYVETGHPVYDDPNTIKIIKAFLDDVIKT